MVAAAMTQLQCHVCQEVFRMTFQGALAWWRCTECSSQCCSQTCVSRCQTACKASALAAAGPGDPSGSSDMQPRGPAAEPTAEDLAKVMKDGTDLELELQKLNISDAKPPAEVLDVGHWDPIFLTAL